MTNKELEAIKRRAAAAKTGTWKVDWKHNLFRLFTLVEYNGHTEERNILHYGAGVDWSIFPSTEDGKFIAHARTDVPALVAEVERLRGLLKEAWLCIDGDLYDDFLEIFREALGEE